LVSFISSPLAAAYTSPYSHTAIGLVLEAGPVVKFVLLLLLFFSVVSWAIILTKMRLFKKAERQNRSFWETFRGERDLRELYLNSDQWAHSPLAQVFRAGYRELENLRATTSESNAPPTTPFSTAFQQQEHADREEILSRSLEQAVTIEVGYLESALIFLATTGSAAPFVGLFGTVWGIMNSFREIGATKSANLAVVAPGISEALIATAVGLAAAIPAVVAYNYFNNRVRSFLAEMENFTGLFLNLSDKHLP